MNVKSLGLALCISTFPFFEALGASRSPGLASVPQIRVRIGSNLKSVEISGTDMTKTIGLSKKTKKFKGRKKLQFNCNPLKKYKNLDAALFLARIDSSTGLLSVGSSKYRGSLQLVAPKSAKGCDVINTLSLETYIGSVLAKEMNTNWPLEALKAQAVAARSYAYNKIKTGQVSRSKGYEAYYDLENSEKHQVNGDFFDVTIRTSRAQRMTSGEVLTVGNGKLVPVFFHSKCGGRTRRPDQVWRNSIEGYENVDCPFCHKRGNKNWKTTMSKKQFYSAIDRALSSYKGKKLQKSVASFRVAPNDSSDPRLRVYDDERLVVMKKSRIRSTLGRRYTMSNSFSVKTDNKNVVLEGKGFGHGVGLCQFGALEMAKRGYNYREILAHYFPKFKLEKLY